MSSNTFMQPSQNVNDEVSVQEIITGTKKLISFLTKKIWKIIIIAFIGGLLGMGFAYFKPIIYTAKLTFMIEEGRSNSGLSGIAGQLGIDIGSLTSGSGGITIFSGDNIFLFLKSNYLTKKTLLTPFDSNNNKYTLADRYADIYELRKKWASSSKVGKEIFFPADDTKYSRLQDSLLQIITNAILKKQLLVERPEKKSTFISVEVATKDDVFSKLFCERIVNNAIEKYIDIKTKRQKINVERLQKRADSIGSVLNYKTYAAAAGSEKILDLNPASRTETVQVEVNTRDKSMLTMVFAEVTKNLEIAKINLNQETPVIQVVDKPDYPLYDNKLGKLKSIIGFALLFAFISALYFSGIYLIKRLD